MRTQHIVVKRNTCTEDTCNNTQRVSASNQWPVKHAQQQFNKCNRMHVHVAMVCTIIIRQVYCMPYTRISIWYVQVYCILECVRICHYDDVQVQVCNNASVCTSVSPARVHGCSYTMCEL